MCSSIIAACCMSGGAACISSRHACGPLCSAACLHGLPCRQQCIRRTHLPTRLYAALPHVAAHFNCGHVVHHCYMVLLSADTFCRLATKCSNACLMELILVCTASSQAALRLTMWGGTPTLGLAHCCFARTLNMGCTPPACSRGGVVFIRFRVHHGLLASGPHYKPTPRWPATPS